MIRVLALCEYPSLTGGEHSLLAAAGCFDPRHIALEWAAPAAGRLADAVRRAGWPLVSWQVHDEAGQRRSQAALRAQLAQLVAARRPHLLHANSVAMARLAGPVARRVGLPSVGHLRDIVRLSAAARADLVCHHRLLAVSAATRDWYVAAGVPRAAIQVLYNGVDLDRFQPGPPTGDLHRQLALPSSAPLLGTMGQLGARKGIDLFLAAAARVAAVHDAARFVVVGQRYSQKAEAVAFERALHATACRGALAGRVHWLGLRDDVPELLRELTLYVHAARQEPLGRVLLEAAASGLPIVATQVGGTGEIFGTTSPCALLVPPDAPARLAAAMSRMLGDPGLRHALGQAARQRATAWFDVREAAAQLVAVYEAVVGG
ncbi:MAG: glycosyltransferase family 4 protein [Pirellulaceae bacterium]|jgi:glycosyltransferase involved in cell wall biosynthesis|nr:glycosyltransferase family 4 protein [Pirellulaceae bacterium]